MKNIFCGQQYIDTVSMAEYYKDTADTAELRDWQRLQQEGEL